MKSMLLAAAGVAAIGSSAMADVIHVWDWSASADGTSGLNMNGGEFSAIHAEFNVDTQRFLWQVTFADQITDGYTLAVNSGPNPKGHAGELALVYFDTTAPSPMVTVYAYNGQNSMTSYRDGSQISGIQSPDMILASDTNENHSAIMQASVVDNMDGSRVMTLELDASMINAHNPAYPGPDGPSEWTGLQFSEALGLWMHPLANLNSSYNQDGSLDQWSGTQGWFDGSNFETTTIPAPAGALALGGAGLLTARRRRA